MHQGSVLSTEPNLGLSIIFYFGRAERKKQRKNSGAVTCPRCCFVNSMRHRKKSARVLLFYRFLLFSQLFSSSRLFTSCAFRSARPILPHAKRSTRMLNSFLHIFGRYCPSSINCPVHLSLSSLFPSFFADGSILAALELRIVLLFGCR